MTNLTSKCCFGSNFGMISAQAALRWSSPNLAMRRFGASTKRQAFQSF
jgi:hypothetical protein